MRRGLHCCPSKWLTSTQPSLSCSVRREQTYFSTALSFSVDLVAACRHHMNLDLKITRYYLLNRKIRINKPVLFVVVFSFWITLKDWTIFGLRLEQICRKCSCLASSSRLLQLASLVLPVSAKLGSALEALQLCLKLLRPACRDELRRLLSFLALAADSQGIKLEKEVFKFFFFFFLACSIIDITIQLVHEQKPESIPMAPTLTCLWQNKLVTFLFPL